MRDGEFLLSYLPIDAPLLLLEPALCEQALWDAEKERQLYFDDLLEARRLTKQQLSTPDLPPCRSPPPSANSNTSN